MGMCDDDLRDRFAEACEDGVPGVAGGVQAETGVDDRDAVAVFDQPQVDVVQREGQRHANPVHAGRDLQGFAGCRQRVEGIFELWGHGFVGSWAFWSCAACLPGLRLPVLAKSVLLVFPARRLALSYPAP